MSLWGGTDWKREGVSPGHTSPNIWLGLQKEDGVGNSQALRKTVVFCFCGGRAFRSLNPFELHRKIHCPAHCRVRSRARSLCNKAELQAIHGIRGYDEALYDPDGAIRGAESIAEFQHRVEQFLAETVMPLLRSSERVLVVAHKYVIELMVRLIFDLPLKGGYDLRLPNSKVLNASDAVRYCRKESRTGNRLREWIVLHHGEVLAGAGLVGLGVSVFFGSLNIPWQLGFVLLMAATMINLLRVDLGQAIRTQSSDWGRTLLRFALIPGLAAIFASAAGAPNWSILIVLTLATPASLTSVTLRRCAGGMVHPAVGTMLRSTLIGTIAILVLVGIFFDWDAAPPIALVAANAIGIPCALALWIRKRKPITAASFAERQAAWPVILLAVFVGMSCAQIDLNDLFTTGVLAVGLSLVLRMVSAALTRWSSCVAPGDYLSLGFPNLFLLVVLGQILGLPELTSFASWLLVPMFLLTPVDVWLCRQFAAKGADDWTLQGYLCLGADGYADSPSQRFRLGSRGFESLVCWLIDYLRPWSYRRTSAIQAFDDGKDESRVTIR